MFRPFHDAAKWGEVKDAAVRTCRALAAHGARHLVLINSISPRARRNCRASRRGRTDGGVAEWSGFIGRIRDVAKMGTEDYGLTVSIHPHAAGFVDFEPEVERLLVEINSRLLRICLDTGHSHYAGFDPVAFLKRHIDRVAYVHFKDIDPERAGESGGGARRILRGLCARGIL